MKTIPLSALLVSALLTGVSTLRAAVVVIDDFEAGEGHFTSIPTTSGSVRRVLPTSTADQSTTQAFQGSASQQLIINRNPDTSASAPAFPAGPGEWFLRHLSGGGTPANNTAIPNTGSTWVGYWVKTSATNLKAGIIIDDVLPAGANHEISTFQDIVSDGLWHLYQFELANAATWETFAGTTPNLGAIDAASVTIDSLAFLGATGVADSSTFYVDNVSYSTDGPIPVPEPSSLGFVGLGALALIIRRKR